MRNVIQQARLSVDQAFQSGRHGIKVADESGDLVAPSAIRVAGSGREVTGRQLLGRGPQASNRLGHIPGEEIANQSRRQYGDDQTWYGHAPWSEKYARARRQLHGNGVEMVSVAGGSRLSQDLWTRKKHSRTLRHGSTGGNMLCPSLTRAP